ncbi:hypothetical protein [uncultured Microbulbifer sp.]|uniref:hypothetical protein n=1 Tax=uncultured Microbulbifer sp. TaxID=348147 RepID=UPI0026283623|nr:hypothetical protein [uncultured Microbulbifer sp.]
MAYSIDKLKSEGIVNSGDALTPGIGVVADARQKSFFNNMVEAGVVDVDFDFKKAYTQEFVDKVVGLDLMQELIGN